METCEFDNAKINQTELVKAMIGNDARAMCAAAMQCKEPEVREDMFARAATASANNREVYVDLGMCRDQGFYMHPKWVRYLDLTWLRKVIIGDVWSFQRGGGVFRRTLRDYASELGVGANKLSCHLRDLVADGYLIKTSNGVPKTSEYTVNVAFCVDKALANGWQPHGSQQHAE